MRTSLIETEQIEAYLLRSAKPGDALLFEAKLILDAGLQDKTQWQQKAYEMIRSYSREQLKMEIGSAHQKLFNQPEHAGFRQKIRRLFLKR